MSMGGNVMRVVIMMFVNICDVYYVWTMLQFDLINLNWKVKFMEPIGRTWKQICFLFLHIRLISQCFVKQTHSMFANKNFCLPSFLTIFFSVVKLFDGKTSSAIVQGLFFRKFESFKVSQGQVLPIVISGAVLPLTNLTISNQNLIKNQIPNNEHCLSQTWMNYQLWKLLVKINTSCTPSAHCATNFHSSFFFLSVFRFTVKMLYSLTHNTTMSLDTISYDLFVYLMLLMECDGM